MIKDAYGNTRFFGTYRAVVVDNVDPLNKGRVKLRIPQVLANEVTDWAWFVNTPGNTFVAPSVGEGVWAQFEGGDPSYPIWLGTFNSASTVIEPATVVEPETNALDFVFNVVGGTLDTQPTFTGAPRFTGRYTKNGSVVHFTIDVDMDNITSFGTGQYYMNLPFPSKYNYQFASGCLHDISTGRDYPIFGHVYAGESRMVLKSIDAQGNSAYNVAFEQGSPITLHAADNFHIAGDYITDV
jgi:hypothetical protein